MENDREKNTEESQDAEQGKDPSVKISSKRKFVSQSQFNDLRTQVTEIQTEMAKLVALLQDPNASANKKRKGALSLEGPENQFLTDPTNDAGNELQHCKMAISLPLVFLGISSIPYGMWKNWMGKCQWLSHQCH